MSDSYVVAVEGISALRDLETIPADVKRAALRAVNTTLRRGRTASAREMRRQVNFPARYLSGKDGRLQITKQATRDDLEGVITGRHRPTSLARFATRGSPGSRSGVTVKVAPGFSRFMRRAFLIRLRAGTANLDTKSNLGLAIRLRPGETIENKRKVVQMGNVHLLYGSSVDQVFRTVAEDVSPDMADFLETEFLRLMELN